MPNKKPPLPPIRWDVERNKLPVFSPICTYCAHWDVTLQGHHCAAFPQDDIPEAIWRGQRTHFKPYPGQVGTTVYTPSDQFHRPEALPQHAPKGED